MVDKVLFRSIYAFFSISINFIIWRVLGFVEWYFIFVTITGRANNNILASGWDRIVTLLVALIIMLIIILINYLFYIVMRRIGEMSKRWMLIPLLTSILTVVISFITF